MSLDHKWLKGVPMELRPRYFPKPPLRFKDIDIYIPLDAIENDYDFTEERRVLAECKMWEDGKEKERLARAEEERIREIADEEERLRLMEQERLEREEAEAAGIAALAAQVDAELELQKQSQNDQNTSPISSSLTMDLNDKLISELNLSDSSNQPSSQPSINNLDNSMASVSEDSNNIIGSSVNSAESSHQESPTSEENSVSSQSHSQSQPYALPQERENMGVVPPAAAAVVPPQQVPYPIMNGYQYMHSTMYHQHHQPQYYNYYMPPAPMAPPPSQYPQASVLPQPLQSNQNAATGSGPSMIYQHQQSQPQQHTFQPAVVASIAPLPPPTSHIPSPTQAIEQHQTTTTTSSAPPPPQYPQASVLPQPPQSNQNAGAGSGPSMIYQHQHQHQQSQPQQHTFQSAVVASIAPLPPPNSHIPSPTQSMEQQQTTTTTSSAPLLSDSSEAATAVNSFTKLTFPFLTSMDASVSRYPRNNYMSSSAPGGGSSVASAPVPTPHNSQDDIVSHNPFLSRYVQSSSIQQQHRHQYWPTSSHLPSHQQQHAPYSATSIPNGGTGPLVHHQNIHHPSSSPNSTGPSSTAAGTQHALR